MRSAPSNLTDFALVWLKGDDEGHPSYLRLVQILRQGAATTRLKSIRSNASVSCTLPICRATVHLLRLYLPSVQRVPSTLPHLPEIKMAYIPTIQSHMGVRYLWYYGLWYDHFFFTDLCSIYWILQGQCFKIGASSETPLVFPLNEEHLSA